MAVATKAKEVNSGIMGIGLSTNEAATSQGLGQYPNLPDTLLAQGKIASKAYSLYLDDLSTSTGMILWGGYDYNKFKGELTMLPIQLDDQSGMKTSFSVAWTGIGTNTPSGDYAVVSDNFVYGAVLDTGTTLTYMPTSIYEVFAKYLGAEESGSGSSSIVLVDCDIGKTTPGQLIYTLGGANGVQIAVDFDELAVPVFSNGGAQATLRNGKPACQFGLADAGSSFSILFGQTFLRSAYVLYDLENLQLGVAQTVFDSTTSNIMEYNGNQTTGRIQSDTSGPTVTVAAQASAVPGNGGGGYGSYGSFTYTAAASGGSFGGQQTGGASIVTTAYNFATFAYPSNALPTSFPTTIGAGATGKVDTNGGSNGGSGGSGSNNGSKASVATSVMAMAGALMMALLSVMLML